MAFGMEETEMRNYRKHLDTAKRVAIKSAKFGAITVGGFMCSMFCYYSYAFYIGTILIVDGVENTKTG